MEGHNLGNVSIPDAIHRTLRYVGDPGASDDDQGPPRRNYRDREFFSQDFMT